MEYVRPSITSGTTGYTLLRPSVTCTQVMADAATRLNAAR